MASVAEVEGLPGSHATKDASSASQLYVEMPAIQADDTLQSPREEQKESNTSANGQGNEQGTDGRPSRQRWRRSVRRVSQQTLILSLFKTLRDMHPEVQIEPEWVRPVVQPRKKNAVLGEGAFAVVEKCVYQPPGAPEGRLVAVKRMKAELLSDEIEITLFVKETDLLRKLKHKNIVQYIGVGGKRDESAENRVDSARLCPDGGGPDRLSPNGPDRFSPNMVAPHGVFLVQELLEGGSLRKKIYKAMTGISRYSYSDALRWALGVAEGLMYLHEAHPMVLHRDLKPENVLLTSKQDNLAEAKICDFGLSALLPTRRQQGMQGSVIQREDPALVEEKSSQELEAEWSTALSKASSFANSGSPSSGHSRKTTKSSGGSLRGTHLSFSVVASKLRLSGKTGSLMYMAPEMYKCEIYSCEVDVFSYGVVLFELFSRVMMVYLVCKKGLHSETEVYAQHVSNGYRPPLSHSVFNNDLGCLVADCWAQDPAARPSMTQVVERLTSIEASGALQALDSTFCGCSVS